MQPREAAPDFEVPSSPGSARGMGVGVVAPAATEGGKGLRAPRPELGVEAGSVPNSPQNVLRGQGTPRRLAFSSDPHRPVQMPAR